ncbi:HK97-gp10 family putative phage morphogenesis protein [Paenibacillus sp. sgz500958]|uniref:HK97-gp10 family putative phage morphogenesis protein n=1 Tax=Paenibacillus sp. sgz500958 TaxID=3242475 RepID=UPI0036D437A5
MARSRRVTNSRTITLDVSGVEDYLARVAAAGRSVDDAVKKALTESAAPIQADISKWAEKHKLTGTTLAGVDVADPQQFGNKIVVQVGIDDTKSPGAWHSTFVEYGTPTQPADPGIRMAFEKNKSKVKKIQREVLKREGLPVD